MLIHKPSLGVLLQPEHPAVFYHLKHILEVYQQDMKSIVKQEVEVLEVYILEELLTVNC